MSSPTPATVKAWLLELQSQIVLALESVDGKSFLRDAWERPEGGGGVSRVIEEGNVFERGGCNFSHVTGKSLPPSAAAARPELAGCAWEAMGVSLVLHPRNPHCPTVHLNVRFFVATKTGEEPVWWFGQDSLSAIVENAGGDPGAACFYWPFGVTWHDGWLLYLICGASILSTTTGLALSAWRKRQS